MVRSAVVGAPMTDTKPAHAADTPDVGAGSDVSDATDPPTPLDASPRPGKTDFAPVIRSKIQPPALRADTLTRERLTKRLDEALAAKVVLVIADAGYGKTTLLSDYASRSGFRTLWYRLSSSDSDAVTWTNYLIAACREVDPTFGAATLSLLESTPAGSLPQSAYVASFLGDIGRWHEAPTMLVLDDFHEIDNNLEVAEIVGRLIEDSPGWLHIVISARRRPKLAFGKLAAAAELQELRTNDLRFSATETARLFSERYSLSLSDAVIRQLDRRTRGWAASLQLFCGSIRGRPPGEIARIADSLTGASGPLYDFLAEEVLASIPDDLAEFLVRASVLDPIEAAFAHALFEPNSLPDEGSVSSWVRDATHLGLLIGYAERNDLFDMHPLLRDFLSRQLRGRLRPSEMCALHGRLANAMRVSSPLQACHHYIEAGLPDLAMKRLGESVLATLGSGQWGAASSLIERLQSVTADPAVAALMARKLTADGNPSAAARLLQGVDIERCTAQVRAVVRQAWISIGWRTNDDELIKATIANILADDETPPEHRDFAELYVAAGAIDEDDARPLPELAQKLLVASETSRLSGHWFYQGISLHNAGIAYLNAGAYQDAIAAGERALDAFARLGFDLSEANSTHSMIATCFFELGRNDEAEVHVRAAISDTELADAPAELAILCASLGRRERAVEFLARADARSREGRTDIAAVPIVAAARAALCLPDNPRLAIQTLLSATDERPFDLGQILHRRTELATAYLLEGNADQSLAVSKPALARARDRSERRSELRLAVLVALAAGDGPGLERSIADAWTGSRLAIAELADVICEADGQVRLDSPAVALAINSEPARWLTALRRQLGKGAPKGIQAAVALDRHGEFEDIARLRAFAKAYRRHGAPPGLGDQLARRTSPKLLINDLGRVRLEIGSRTVALSGMRRKAASLLMYLVTQPSFTANKEQVLDALWPDADPGSATNSLNQSLYFLRREIDPWFEDDLAVDYVHFEGDLIWLDPSLVASVSADFVRTASAIRGPNLDASAALALVTQYRGHFAPEFEYEEWAMDWRSRVHSVLLSAAHEAIERLSHVGDLVNAREISLALLEIDPSAAEIERRLIWLLWQAGSTSAARAQYAHLAAVEAREGLPTEPFDSLVKG
jgi:DNA-binding SARP family transcriptional activator